MPKKVISLFLLILLSFTLNNCSSVRSGKYRRIQRGETLTSLAHKVNVPTWELEAANQGLKFRPGNWVFVPKPTGIVGQAEVHFGHMPALRRYLKEANYLWPVPSSKKVSSHFGRRWGRAHEGFDIAAPVGSFILAAQSGVVVYSGKGIGGYGNLTVISHKFGLFTVYAHAKQNFTRVGQQVHRGQVIAKVGKTGRTTGPHLHFELRVNSKAFDPMMLY